MDSTKLPITGPCPIDLDAIGYDRGSKVSHCSHCDKSVHNLSTMTEADARAFLREHAGQKLCVTYARTGDGVIQFKRDPQIVPLGRLARRSATAAAGVGLAAALAACTPHSDAQHEEGEAMPVEIAAGGLAAPDLDEDEKQPCDKPEDPDAVDMVEGEIEAPPPQVAGAMKVPEPEMLGGEALVEPTPTPEPKPEPLEHVDGEMPIPE